MRMPTIVLSLGSLAAACSPAGACGVVPTACLPAAVAYPVYTLEGLRIGAVRSAVMVPLRLELSRYSGQPVTVVYNDPDRIPGSVEPRLELVPLPRSPQFHTRAAYPRGY